MEILTKEYLGIQRIDVEGKEKKHLVIAQAIVDAVQTKKIMLGSLVSSQVILADNYNVSLKVMEKVWKQLRDVHKIIVTQRRKGTYVVDVLPGRKKVVLLEEENLQVSHQRILLDQQVIPAVKELIGSFFGELSKSFLHDKGLTVKEKSKKVIPELVDHFRKVVNSNLRASFTRNEIYYYQDYYFIICSLCKAFLSADEVFVMGSPVFTEVKNAVKSANRNIKMISSDPSGINITDLRQACKELKVGLVYIRSSSPHAGREIISEEKMNNLLDLQSLYQFHIIFDNRYVGVLSSGDFAQGGDIAKNSGIIYLQPVSRLDERLYEINIIAAHRDLMQKIKKQFDYQGFLVEPHLAYALLGLMDRDLVHKHEVKANKEMEANFKIAVREIRASGLFKEEGLSSTGDWFIYLEPAYGSFKPEVYAQLEEHSISTFDADFFDVGEGRGNGILISLPPKKSERQLIEIIQTLINVLKAEIR